MVSPFTMAKHDGKKSIKAERDRKKQAARSSIDRAVSAIDNRLSCVCSSCEVLGDLLCCNHCKKGFHLSCLGFDEVPDIQDWLCSDCLQNKVRCFDCKEYGSLVDGTIRCSYKNCQNYFHPGCINKWATIKRMKSNVAKRGYICPHHFCHACLGNKNSASCKLVHCLRCPVAYHSKCCPEGANLLEDIPGFLLCEKHNNADQVIQDLGQKNNPVAILKKLPVPDMPVDFEVPDWLKKRKAHSYTFIKRNIYVTKKCRKRLMDDGMQCSCRPSPDTAIVCGKDCLCGMLLSSCSSSCGCGESCANKPFDLRTPKRLKLSKTEKCGWGLKADEDIKEGEFLIEYVGEVIDDRTCEERLWKMKDRGEKNFYLCEINREMVIDATFKANKSRYINHSCHPNTELQKWQTDGETRIGVFAIRDIRRGEFVTYDYQFIQFGTEQQCYCGAQDCRGVLGAKPSKQKLSSDAAMKLVAQEVVGLKALKNLSRQASTEGTLALASSHKEKTRMAKCIGQRVRIWWPIDERFYGGRIAGYDPTCKKHMIVYDDGDEELLDMSKERWDFDSTQECHTAVNRSADSCSDNTRFLQSLQWLGQISEAIASIEEQR